VVGKRARPEGLAQPSPVTAIVFSNVPDRHVRSTVGRQSLAAVSPFARR
jgi:hypothetical protein